MRGSGKRVVAVAYGRDCELVTAFGEGARRIAPYSIVRRKGIGSERSRHACPHFVSRRYTPVMRAASLIFTCLLCLNAAACSHGSDNASGVVRVIGAAGTLPGSFATPRGVSVANNRLWVVDRSGRIQAFSLDGKNEINAAVIDGSHGYPIGIMALEDGGCWVCDTHNNVMRHFDATAQELLHFGGVGQEHGKFTWPEHVARDADGLLYVTEYGEGAANRVQVFTPEGKFARAFGEYGTGPGQFSRVIGIVVVNKEAFICDVSDRIIVYSTEGKYLREFGRNGGGVGEFRYPYGICLYDGLLYIAEYGNHRIQRFTLTGESRGCFGKPGTHAGEFNGPWDICAGADGFLYVADTGNHRVVVLDPKKVSWKESQE